MLIIKYIYLQVTKRIIEIEHVKISENMFYAP